MRRYWLVAIGGGIGTLMRFGISEWINGMGLWNPLVILIINVSGCFLISFLSFVSDPSGEFYLGPRSRIFLLVGLCGGYTHIQCVQFTFLRLCTAFPLHGLVVEYRVLASLLPARCMARLSYRYAIPQDHSQNRPTPSKLIDPWLFGR